MAESVWDLGLEVGGWMARSRIWEYFAENEVPRATGSLAVGGRGTP